MARRTLVVMEGGHPWGFRIEGGAEVRQPIRINKVLMGGKAESHGIQVGDVVNCINGESGSNMTISRARHLIRTSDDLLILEVSRPSKETRQIPEIRIISPNETQITNGTKLHWGPNTVLGSCSRNDQNAPTFHDSRDRTIDVDRVNTMSSTPDGPLRVAPSSHVPLGNAAVLPSPRPPIALKISQSSSGHDGRQRGTVYTYPLPPSPAGVHSRNPVALETRSPSGTASSGMDISSLQGNRVWHNEQNFNAICRSPPSLHGGRTFTVPGQSAGPNLGPGPHQRYNTEPAPIKPPGLGRQPLGVRPGLTDSPGPFGSRPWSTIDAKQFRSRTVDTGLTERNLSSTAVVQPLNSTLKGTSYNVSEFPYGMKNHYIRQSQHGSAGDQQDKRLNSQDQKKFLTVQHENLYNDRKKKKVPTATLR